jgi:hypothetical protein
VPALGCLILALQAGRLSIRHPAGSQASLGVGLPIHAPVKRRDWSEAAIAACAWGFVAVSVI